jgi:hypothetical protein
MYIYTYSGTAGELKAFLEARKQAPQIHNASTPPDHHPPTPTLTSTSRQEPHLEFFFSFIFIFPSFFLSLFHYHFLPSDASGFFSFIFFCLEIQHLARNFVFGSTADFEFFFFQTSPPTGLTLVDL